MASRSLAGERSFHALPRASTRFHAPFPALSLHELLTRGPPSSGRLPPAALEPAPSTGPSASALAPAAAEARETWLPCTCGLAGAAHAAHALLASHRSSGPLLGPKVGPLGGDGCVSCFEEVEEDFQCQDVGDDGDEGDEGGGDEGGGDEGGGDEGGEGGGDEGGDDEGGGDEADEDDDDGSSSSSESHVDKRTKASRAAQPRTAIDLRRKMTGRHSERYGGPRHGCRALERAAPCRGRATLPPLLPPPSHLAAVQPCHC